MDVKAISTTQASFEVNTLIQGSSSREHHKKEWKAFDELRGAIDDDIIQKGVEALNEKLKLFSDSLQIEIDKETGIQVVKIVDDTTKEVVKQLPPETMLKIAKYIDEVTGLLFDKKV